jgi:hypothetical protein
MSPDAGDGAIMGRWLHPQHARKHHSFWWVCRNGARC